MREKKYDVFLTYCHRDSDVVIGVAKQLVSRELKPFVDVWELKLGDILVREIESALMSARAGIVFFSSKSLESPWVRQEYDRMITQANEDPDFRLIPVRLDSSPLPGFAKDRLWYELFEHSEQGINALVREILRALNVEEKIEINYARGASWGSAAKLSARILYTIKALNLDNDQSRELREIAILLNRDDTCIRKIGKCECGGEILCGHVDLGGVDYYDNYFHICTGCFAHRHKEEYTGIGQECNGFGKCPWCGYQW